MEEGVHILLRGSSREEGDLVRKLYYKAKSAISSSCKCKMQKYFKKQSSILKLGGKYIHESWRWGVHWEMFYGYTPYKGVENMENEVREWLVKRRVLGGVIGERRYLEMLVEETARLCEEEWRLPKQTLAIKEWVATGEWMRGKSGDGQRNEVLIDGKKCKSRRMKSTDAVFRSDASMVKMLKQVKDEVFAVMEKSEGAKVRPVVKTGSDMFRKMDYLSQWVEDGFFHSKLSTLFGGAQNQEDIDNELLQVAENWAVWKVPLDQSNFDWHQSRLSIEAVVATLGVEIAKRVATPDFDVVWEAMWDSLFARPVRVKMGAMQWEWGNGLPSGLRWTALLDTVLNITSFRVAVRLSEEATGKGAIDIIAHKSQGDDVAFACKDLDDVATIVHIYNKLGYEAHPAKTFYSKYRTEFLRKSYEAGVGITGYVCRSLLSIRFRNPILDLAVERATRVYSRLTTWHLLSIRGMNPVKVAEMYIEDCNQMGVKPVFAAGYALCHAAFGGAGLRRSSKLGTALLRWYERPYTYEVEVEGKRISPFLGHWNGRIKHRLDRYLMPHNYEHLYKSLSLSWGIREIDLVGRVKVVWKECNLVPWLTAPAQERARDPESLWDLRSIPTMVRNDVKEGALERGLWKELVKPESVGWLEKMEARTSKVIFREYMLGRIKAPWPIVDGIAMKYGQRIRKVFEDKLATYIFKRDLSIIDISRICASLEDRTARALEEMGRGKIMGV